VITNLQHVVSRNTPPLDSVVVSVTRIRAGTTDNIIPEAVELGGTVRTYREELRQQTRTAIERILDGVTAAHAATYELDYTRGYDPVVNDPEVAAVVREAAGDERVVEFDPLMAGDELLRLPQCVARLLLLRRRRRRGQRSTPPSALHDDEAALPVLAETTTRAALRFLNAAPVTL
jgi:metal-dependent amidase/aminoacylase/carboxypeptidase family protein